MAHFDRYVGITLRPYIFVQNIKTLIKKIQLFIYNYNEIER